VVAQRGNDCLVYVCSGHSGTARPWWHSVVIIVLCTCAVAMVAQRGNDCCVHVQWLWWHGTVMIVVYMCSGYGGTAR